MKRKSAVDLTDLALGIIILGITVSIGAVLLTQYRDNRLTDLSTNSVVNETTDTVVNTTGVVLDTNWVSSVDACYNSSGHQGGAIAAANYTTSVDPVNGYVTLSAAGGASEGYNNTQWNCTYTVYNTTEAQWSLPNDAALGLAEYGNWFDIIIIVGVAGLILALIFMAFGRRGGDEGVGISY